MFARINDSGAIVEYPLGSSEIKARHPNTSFPAPFAPPDGYTVVLTTPRPTFDQVTRVAREAAPVRNAEGRWEQRWEVVSRFTEYTDGQGVAHTVAAQEAAAVAAAQAAKNAALQASIVEATQARLDAFARARGYDDIKSASDYAGCSVPKFSIEGTYCRDARAQTWAKLYDMLAEVQAGTRPMPTGFADVEPELPALVWPS